MNDLVIKDALVADGTGAPMVRGDVAVRDGRIVEIGRIDGAAKERVDARRAGYLSHPASSTCTPTTTRS